MAHIDGNLWEYNFARVLVLDVSSDYELMTEPLPACCYPLIAERWIPRWNLPTSFPEEHLVPGYLYDWHEKVEGDSKAWYVGVVREELATSLLANLG